jgi:hypothetical protein
MCFALISSEPAYDRTFGCPLRISRRATERDNGSSLVFQAADLLVLPQSSLFRGWRWSMVSDGSF